MDIEKLKQYKDEYIKKLESDRKSSSTIKSYSYHIDNMIESIKNNYSDDFDVKIVILDYIDNLNVEYKTTTINIIRSAVRGFITFMKSRDYIKEDFGGNITLLREDITPKEVLKPSEIESIFNTLISELKKAEGYKIYHKARNLALFSFLLYTGIRRGEVVKIRWKDIDFINNVISVTGKGNKTRVIPLLPDLKQQLYSYRDIIEQMNNAGYNVKSEYLFRSEKINRKTNKKDKPMTGKNVEVIIKEICAASGIKKNITPHNIRHTFASYAIKNKMNLPSLSDILGHANLSTTLNIYAHEISMEEKKREMKKVRFDI